MTRIEFHVVESGTSDARASYASDWLSALGEHVQAHVLCDCVNQQHTLKSVLSRQKHITLLSPDSPPPRPDTHTVLINLSTSVPSFFSRYRCAIDIADKCGESVDADRLRYRFYRDRGYPITLHKIEAQEVA